MSADFPAAVVRAIKLRSRGICEGCGLAPARERHHRQYRSRSGPNTVENGLDLCGFGNTAGCHKVAHDGREGERRGWAIRSGHDPAKVPALLVINFVRVWVVLTADGLRKPISEETARGMLAEIGVAA